MCSFLDLHLISCYLHMFYLLVNSEQKTCSLPSEKNSSQIKSTLQCHFQFIDIIHNAFIAHKSQNRVYITNILTLQYLKKKPCKSQA